MILHRRGHVLALASDETLAAKIIITRRINPHLGDLRDEDGGRWEEGTELRTSR